MKKDNSLFLVIGGTSEVGTQFIERCFRKMPNSFFYFTGENGCSILAISTIGKGTTKLVD